MVTPRIIPRAEHTLSRRDIDPDALKVLNRLRQFDHVAYLVGGSVRDLLLGRRPKDFDIGTSAHPLRSEADCSATAGSSAAASASRTCKFGPKTIEVATFRRQVSEEELEALARAQEEAADAAAAAPDQGDGAEPEAARPAEPDELARAQERERSMHRDNTFGTPEEDAFRRDFTVNALFYDIATFSVIDYVGGLEDLHARVIRSIGDPNVRFHEDPVRMLRAIVLAARLDFTIDPPDRRRDPRARRRDRPQCAGAADRGVLQDPAVGSGGASVPRSWPRSGLLSWIAPELLADRRRGLWQSLAALDRYRHRFEACPTR